MRKYYLNNLKIIYNIKNITIAQMNVNIGLHQVNLKLKLISFS